MSTPPLAVDDEAVAALLRLSLAEDVGPGDLTSLYTVPADLQARARIVAREPLVVSGLVLFEPLRAALEAHSADLAPAAGLEMVESLDDGAHLDAGDVLGVIAGPACALLTIERTFLNFVAHLSGIATATAAFVSSIRQAGAPARLLDTRKTTPGMRVLEKYAVRCGGGSNHRQGLFDAILIKDNHVVAAGGLGRALAAAREGNGDRVPLEVECDTLAQVETALAGGAPAILLDNFSPAEVARAVRLVAGRARVEVSGGVTLATVAEYARAGADDISVGHITHSARAVDLSMEMTLDTVGTRGDAVAHDARTRAASEGQETP